MMGFAWKITISGYGWERRRNYMFAVFNVFELKALTWSFTTWDINRYLFAFHRDCHRLAASFVYRNVSFERFIRGLGIGKRNASERWGISTQ
jgi:hypothetical protein